MFRIPRWNTVARRRPLASVLVVACAAVASGLLWYERSTGRRAQPADETRDVDAARQRLAQGYGRLPIRFEANEGQFDARVDFVARGPGYGLFLTGSESVLVLTAAVEPEGAAADATTAPKPDALVRSEVGVEPRPLRRAVVRARPAGGNLKPRVSSGAPLPGHTNYFLGNDPAAWRTKVTGYESVRYHEVYPGIDLVYHGNQRELEYDFIVSPGVDPSVIRVAFEGAEHIEIDAGGDLILETSTGQVRQRRPVAYQEVRGERTEVSARFALVSDTEVAFELGEYDPSRPLVIDPVLVYSTYLGGNHVDHGRAIAIDAAGSAYVTGRTDSLDFPLAHALQSEYGGDFGDAFVTKLAPDGLSLVYSTYLGGSSHDSGAGIGVDAAGNAYVTGRTRSLNFPVANAVQNTIGVGDDAFVTQLNADGSQLLYSTYLGGSGNDSGDGIAVDAAGNAYVTGQTWSTDFPLANALQDTNASISAFVTKLNANGSALVYSTYLGGSNEDIGLGIAVDVAGNAYVTGYTESSDFPIANAFQSHHGGGRDAFVTTLNTDGSALVYSSFLGGISADVGRGIAVDVAGSAFVIGQTLSTTFPVTPGAFQTTKADFTDAFVSRLNADGTLAYSTFIGGSGSDEGHAIAVDATGNMYVTGMTGSTDFPVVNAVQSPAGGHDAFVAKLNAAGSALMFSTHLGGSSTDLGQGIAVDPAENVYVVGLTLSSNFPRVNAYQADFLGSRSAFVAKISTIPNTSPVAHAGTSFAVECTSLAGTPVWLDGSASYDPDDDPLTFEWRDASGTVIGTTAAVQVLLPLGEHTFMLTVSDGLATDTAEVTISVVDTTAPVTVASYPDPNPDGWYDHPIQVSLLATDACSGVAAIRYTQNGLTVVESGGGASMMTASVAVSSEGVNTLSYFATDEAGNAEAETTLTFSLVTTTFTMLESSQNPSVFGQPIVFTATVRPLSPSVGMPTGTVTFLRDGAMIGVSELDGFGQATFAPPALAAADHTISAVYSGAPGFAASASGPLTQTVDAASTTTTLTVVGAASGGPGAATWVKHQTTTSPGARRHHTLVYDAASDRAILFGGRRIGGASGNNDVWVLEHASGVTGTPAWIQLFPGGTPPATRYGASAVYDAATNRMMVFGGRAGPPFSLSGSDHRNDVWVLTNANGLGGTPQWIEVAPSGSLPPARMRASAVYDAGNNRMIVFGGNLREGHCFETTDDTWVLSHANGMGGTPVWAQLAPTGAAPSKRWTHTAVYDATANRMVVMGGADACAPPDAGVWSLAGANGLDGTPQWQSLGAAPPLPDGPSGRGSHTAVLDEAAHRMIVFAGGAFTPPSTNHGERNDVWVMSPTDGSSGPPWTEILPGGPLPAPRWGHTAVFDRLRGRMIVFGGSDDDLDTWVLRLPSEEPGSSIYGDTVTLQAAVDVVAPGGGVPEGVVTFRAGGTVLGTAPLEAGPATFATSTLPVGMHSLTAEYSGSDSFVGSSGSTIHLVEPAPTTTSVASSGSPTVFGEPVTFTATVIGQGMAVTTGTITFTANGTTLAGPVALDAGGQATFNTAFLGAGPHEIVATYSGSANFAASQGSVAHVVNRAPTNTMVSASVGASVFGDDVTFTAFVSVLAPGSGSPDGTMTFTAGETTLGTAAVSAGVAAIDTSALPAGTHEIVATYRGSAAFVGSSGALAFVVDKATPVITWPPPAPITYGTPLSEAQLNATADVPGTFLYTPAPGTILGAGTHTLTATFLPDDPANYHAGVAPAPAALVLDASASPATGPLHLAPGFGVPQGNRQPFDTAGNLAFVGNGFEQPAVARDVIPGFDAIHQPQFANDGLYGNGSSWIGDSPDSWVKIDLGRHVEIGRVRLGRDRTGGYNDRDPGRFLIGVATADNVYANGDESNDEVEYQMVFDSGAFGYDGLIHRDQTIEARFPAVTARYIKITATTFGAALDEIEVFAPELTGPQVTLVVEPRPASATPDPASKIYGDVDPALTGTLSGFLDADGVTATYTRTAGETVLGGPYTISATLSPADVLSNYAVAHHTAPFSIHPRDASVTPNAASKIYGEPDPAFTGILAGFLDADGVTATYHRDPGETVLSGPYTISATLSPADVLSNYLISFATASLEIAPRPASVTPDPASKIYGDADPALTGTLDGFLAADGVTATYTRTAGETVLGGPYTISATLSPADVLSNYDVGHHTAPFTIVPAPLVITADDTSKLLGAPLPAFTATVMGFVFSDNLESLDGTLTFSTPATPESPVGLYPVEPGGLASSNYAIAFVPGTLTIRYAICVLYDTTRGHRSGSTIPIRIQLCDAFGNNVSSAAITVRATGVFLESTNAEGILDDAGEANPDDNFRFTGGTYLYNLRTAGFVTGTYRLTFTVSGDSSTYAVPFQVR